MKCPYIYDNTYPCIEDDCAAWCKEFKQCDYFGRLRKELVSDRECVQTEEDD